MSSVINPGSFGMGFLRVDNPAPPAEPSGRIPAARSPSGNPAVPKEALQRAIPSSAPTRPTPPKASDLSGTVGASIQGLVFENGASAINARISGGLSLELAPRTTVGLSAFVERQRVNPPNGPPTDRTLLNVEGNLRRTFAFDKNANVVLTGFAGAEALDVKGVRGQGPLSFNQVTIYGGVRAAVNYSISREWSGSAFASAQLRAPSEQPRSGRLEQGVGLTYRPDNKNFSLNANASVRQGFNSEGFRLERVTGALQFNHRVNGAATVFGKFEYVTPFTGPGSWGVTVGGSVKL